MAMPTAATLVTRATDPLQASRLNRNVRTELTINGHNNEERTMKYLTAMMLVIALIMSNFTFTQPAQASGSSSTRDSMFQRKGSCAEKERNRRAYYEKYRTYNCNRTSEIDDIDPPTETAQGGDRDGDADDGFGGDGDRTAASTAAE